MDRSKIKTDTSNNNNDTDLIEYASSNMNVNKNITDVLEQYLEQIKNESNMTNKSATEKNTIRFRKAAIEKDIKLIKELSIKLESGKQALELLKGRGIGQKMADKIDEILKTGTLSNLDTTKTDEVRVIEELKSIKGIGDVNAKKLYNEYNIKSIEQLKKEKNTIKFNLTHEMQIGLKYYDDFKQKIPYDEIELIRPILEIVLDKLDNNLKYEICGSHRRDHELSGDIDILITHTLIKNMVELKKTKINYLHEIVKELINSDIIIETIALDTSHKEGTSMLFRGVCLLKRLARQLDIHFVSNDIYYTALLHFTGSKNFNVEMRDIALKNGYTLTEHGLYELDEDGKKGKMCAINSEKDIFDILHVKYIAPSLRD